MNRIRQSEKNKTRENQPGKIKSQRKLIFPRQPNEKFQMTGDIKNWKDPLKWQNTLPINTNNPTWWYPALVPFILKIKSVIDYKTS